MISYPTGTWARFASLTGRALSAPLLLWAYQASACTFYTGQPNGNGNTNPPATAGSGGASTIGGSGNGEDGGGVGGGSAGTDGGAGGGVASPWIDVTGSLTGKSNAPGDVIFISAKPDEDMLITGLNGFGLWASSDGGDHWYGLGISGASDPVTNGVTGLVFDPKHPQVFWEAGIYGPGVFRTDDNGVTTKRVGGVDHIEQLSVDLSDPDRKTMLAGPHETDHTLFLSKDGGDTWTKIGQNLPPKTGYSSYPVVIDSTTYLAGCVNLIARSTDSGATWKTVSQVGGAGPALVAADGSIYWGTEGDSGLMRSTDHGLTWTRIVGGGVVKSRPLLQLPDGRLVGQNEQYVLVSPDSGESWQVASAPFPYKPKGLAYSAQRKAFYIFTDSQLPKIPARSIVRFDWDYEAQ